MSEPRYELVRQFGFLSNSLSGWSTELNLISWNDGEPGGLRPAVARVETLRGDGLFGCLLAEYFGGKP